MNDTKILLGLNGGNCTQPSVCTCTSLWKGSVCEIAQGISSYSNACYACFRRSMSFQSLSTQYEVFTNCKICLRLTHLNHFLFYFLRVIRTSKPPFHVLMVQSFRMFSIKYAFMSWSFLVSRVIVKIPVGLVNCVICLHVITRFLKSSQM